MLPKSSASLIFRCALLLGAALPLGWSATALAQPRTVEGRVDKLEQEMRAVQRKVFPGGAGQIVAPEVSPTAPAPGAPVGAPATSPVADLEARVNAIQSQLARLTGQVEEQGHRLSQMEEAIQKLNAAPVLPAAVPTLQGSGAAAAPAAPAQTRSQPAAAAGPNAAQRNEQVAAIERPSTGNGALDGYTYGYRLWQAKFYPEAQAQLESTLEKFPNDGSASRTANLLGRAFLDDGKPTRAVKLFYENYRMRPKGDRAAESLAWTGEALLQLKDNQRACAAYDELAEVFGGTMPANVRDMMTKGRVRAKCGA